MSGIYLHIPFCKHACSYCDFYFVTRNSEREHFVKRLLEEIEDFRGTKFTRETVETIYFGGGTPSLLEPKQIERVLDNIYSIFEVEPREITFEMNPDDVSKEFLSDLKTLGIHRASMGVQSFQPELLEFMNRAHSRDEALRCMELLSKSDFKSFTVDLIYGNPNETMEQLKADLQLLLQYNPPHVSAYSLTIDPNTRLGKQVELGRIAPPEDDKVADQFDVINEHLRKHGIERYEVSNYSRPGSEAVHNSSYWEHENYLGLGPAAHSFWWDDEAVRWDNERNLRGYLRNQFNQEREFLSNSQLAEERIMMGLRTRKGVSVKELSERYDYEINERQQSYLDEREKESKLTFGDRIVLSDRGIKIADAIILDLITLH